MSPTKLSGTHREIGITTRINWQPTKLQARFIALLNAEFHTTS